MLNESYESGEINKNEINLVNNVFIFDEMIARKIMIPRTEMIAIEDSITLNELMSIIQTVIIIKKKSPQTMKCLLQTIVTDSKKKQNTIIGD